MTDAVPGDTQRVILADEGRFTDLTARLAAADAGWCLTYGDERADPAYIRWLARHIDAFEDHASPAAPADDEAAVLERIRAALRFVVNGALIENQIDALAVVALAALREGQQQ